MGIITWYGHSAFKIESMGVSVLLDPFFAPGTGLGPENAGHVDLVLISHDHGDHVGSAVEICQKTGAALGCVVGTAEAMLKRGVPGEQMLNGIGFNIGGSVSFKGMTVTMTQAFHSSDSAVPVGYMLGMPDGLRVYHAGDTGIFASMSLLGELYRPDLALLPIGGVFTMDGFQAAHACRLLGAETVIPMHYGTFPQLARGTDDFRVHLEKICPSCSCLEMEIGRGHELMESRVSR